MEVKQGVRSDVRKGAYRVFVDTLRKALNNNGFTVGEADEIFSTKPLALAELDIADYVEYALGTDFKQWLKENFSSAEFPFFINSLVKEWAHQYRERFEVEYEDGRAVAEHILRGEAPDIWKIVIPPLPAALIEELMAIAIKTLISNGRVCMLRWLAKRAIVDAVKELGLRGRFRKKWAEALRKAVRRNAEGLAKAPGPIRVTLPGF